MTDLPEGYVDPRDPARVTAVLQAVVEQTGLAGLLDLLARIPGTRVDPGSRKGFLRAAVPPSTWVGLEHRLVLVSGPVGDQLEDHHVVGGVTLARDTLTSDRAPGVVARHIAYAVAVGGPGADQEASAALTAYRDLYVPPDV
jgi:hypothetical protein